ncbi:MAG TPA: c-type cytochrome [Bradyrhizobium sp.]
MKPMAAALRGSIRRCPATPICNRSIPPARCVILDGAQTVTTPRAPNLGSMPAYAKQLSDQEIADVTNYIRNSWGNAAPLVTPAQVKKARMQ